MNINFSVGKDIFKVRRIIVDIMRLFSVRWLWFQSSLLSIYVWPTYLCLNDQNAPQGGLFIEIFTSIIKQFFASYLWYTKKSRIDLNALKTPWIFFHLFAPQRYVFCSIEHLKLDQNRLFNSKHDFRGKNRGYCCESEVLFSVIHFSHVSTWINKHRLSFLHCLWIN